jgi:hypothetical protein
MNRARTLAAPLLAGALAAAVPFAAAGASPVARTRSVHLSGTGTSEPNAPIGLTCDSTARCLVSTLIPGTIDGDVVGTTTTRGASFGNLATGDYFGSSVQMITGSVAGCGSGSFTVSLADFSGNLASPASATGIVVPDSGTGDLAGITGRAAFRFVPGDGGAGTYTYVMQVRCRAS